MTIGIYKLNFNGTDKVYIGMSNNIEIRYTKHLASLKYGTASRKMLDAYKVYGQPSIEVLCICAEEELYDLENEAIDIFNSIENGYNTINISNGKICHLQGEDASHALYSKDVYLNILELLANTTFNVQEISDTLKVSSNVVSQIKQLVNHNWLKEASPTNYSIVEEKLSKYRKSGRTLESRGKDSIIVSPDGLDVHITSLAETCKKYALDSGNLSKLISGKILYYKGWRLRNTPSKPRVSYKSPEGAVYVLNTSILEFSKQHGLDNSSMIKLSKGLRSTHKGWTFNGYV